MFPRALLVLFALAVILLPWTVRAEEPDAPAAAPLPPWAAVRRALREKAAKKMPPAFTSRTSRKIHERAGEAADAALAWLAAHQSPDGRWGAEDYCRWCNGAQVPMAQWSDGLGLRIYDVGVTGLALTALLVAGHDGTGGHAHDDAVRKGLTYLRKVQDQEGCYGKRVVSPFAEVEYAIPGVTPRRAGQRGTPRKLELVRDRKTFLYNHGAAALAMVEAAGSTGDVDLIASAQRALDFVAEARGPHSGWGYGVKSLDIETFATGWMMMPLRTAWLIDKAATKAGQPAPFTLDEEAFDGIETWIDKVTDPDSGRAAYRFRGSSVRRLEAAFDACPPENSEALTAVAVLARVFGGENPWKSKPAHKGLELCKARPPRWSEMEGVIDMIYWHFATLAMHQYGAPQKKQPSSARREWGSWLLAVETALVENQRTDGAIATSKGTWDPIGPWGQAGGRVYATALNALTLLTRVRFEAGGT